MKNQSRQRLWFFVVLLALAAIACGTSTGEGDTSTANTIDEDVIIANAVATIDARQPAGNTTPATAPVVTSGSIIDSELQQNLIRLYEVANPSVVHIFGTLGTGTGFVYDTDGHIITNNHVLASGTEFEVAFFDGTRREATVVGTDVDSDLAVIRVTDPPASAPPVTLGDSAGVIVGEFVITIGNPFLQESSMSFGIVSGLGRSLRSQRGVEGGGFYSLPRVIQVDAPINPGNSGGPLLNMVGEVIGVNSAISSETGVNSGVGYSIPINIVKRVVPALIEDGAYTYPFMGVQIQSITLLIQEELELPSTMGALLTGITAGQPADEAGLVRGDVVVEINGAEIVDSDALIAYLVFESEVGETIDLTILREGETLNIPLTLAARP